MDQNETQTPIQNPQSQPPKSHWRFHLPWWAWVSILIVVVFGVGYWAWSISLFSNTPSVYEDINECDVDQSGVCDESDKKIIESLLSVCAGASNFNALADGNHDGCITLQDVDFLFPEDETAGWQTYSNEEYGFEINYPKEYELAQPPELTEHLRSEGYSQIAELTHTQKAASILIFFEDTPFDLEQIREMYAPTGIEFMPELVAINENKFYRYGPGGGGVEYPDRYFVNIRGKTLIFVFDGPYQDDKTPTAEAKEQESQILSTFRLIWKTWKSEVLGVEFMYPSDWEVYEINVPDPNDPTPAIISAKSPNGSNFLVLPYGGEGFSPHSLQSRDRGDTAPVSGFVADRIDFETEVGELRISVISVDVPGFPDYSIQLRIADEWDEPVLENILETVKIYDQN